MRLALALVGGLLAAAAAAEDLTIVSKVTRGSEPPGTATSYIGAAGVRMTQPEGQEFMVELQSGRMTVIDGRKKEYYVITPEDLKAAGARMQEQMKAMEPQMKQAQEQMKNAPPQARELMEKMMGGLGASVTVQKGSSKKVAGYNCDLWTVSFGQVSKTEQCLTSELPFPAQSWDRYREYAESMKATLAAMGPMGKGLADLGEKTKEMKGIPLWSSSTTSVFGKTTTSTSEVTEIRKGPIPDSVWQVPAGYKQVDAPLKKMLK
jgi:hypothetical protein